MTKLLKGALPCFLAAVIWGLSFVFQTTAMDTIREFTFSGVRMVLAVLVLFPASVLSAKFSKEPPMSAEEKRASRKTLWKAGILCGICLFAGFNLQQFAFVDTPTGKIGFLTAQYMVIVPVLGTIFFHKKIELRIGLGVLLAVFGNFLLCIQKGSVFSFGRGELLSLSCSLFFALQILIVDLYAPRIRVLSLSCVQFAVAGVMSLVCMFIFERPTMSSILAVAPELLYAGVMSSAGAFTLQLYGQKHTDPVLASMLLCLESVFSALFGWLILKQMLTSREIVGCAIMFTAIVLALIPKEIWLRLFHIKPKLNPEEKG